MLAQFIYIYIYIRNKSNKYIQFNLLYCQFEFINKIAKNFSTKI